MNGFAFHAAAPPGEWLNDPNGLAFSEGRYRLVAQHAADAPDFKQIGWGAFSSDDLLHWQWDGVEIAPQSDGWAYSGSVVRGDTAELEMFLTRHDPIANMQTQERVTGARDQRRFEAFGPSGRNCRDPFVFPSDGGWAMLVARPCDWHDWASDPPSQLELWRSPDRETWSLCGIIGPWFAAGVMWEVPALIDFGEVQVLLISIVDRRAGGAACSVRYWTGDLTKNGFAPHAGCPTEGRLLDAGPDFYAAIPNLVSGWPSDEHVIIGWAANWSDARQRVYPGNAHGGPIALPRVVRLDATGSRLIQTPIAAAAGLARSVPVSETLITVSRGDSALTIECRDQELQVTMARPDSGYSSHSPLIHLDHPNQSWQIFEDGPLIEIFTPHGMTVTAVL